MLALLYIDLDGFKPVNDSLGHRIGDLLLKQVAERLQTRARGSDTLARIGGDEFTLILSRIHSKADAEKVAASLLEALTSPFQIDGQGIRIGASIGISLFPEHGRDGDELLQQADFAMYAAKRSGKNRIVEFSDDLGKRGPRTDDAGGRAAARRCGRRDFPRIPAGIRSGDPRHCAL